MAFPPRPRSFPPRLGDIFVCCGLLACAVALLSACAGGGASAGLAGHATAVQYGPSATRWAARAMPATYTFTPPGSTAARSTPTPTPTFALALPPEACVPANTEILVGDVTGFSGGEALQVQIQDGSTLTVVYASISVPAGSAESSQQMAVGRQVVLVRDVSDRDGQGRLVRYVLVDGRLINYELVWMGLARVIDSPDAACLAVLRDAEAAAQKALRGLWAPTPIPTRTFLPTVGSIPGDRAACDCSVRWECADFNSQARAQACLNACNDYNTRLDDDHDGLACEQLP